MVIRTEEDSYEEKDSLFRLTNRAIIAITLLGFVAMGFITSSTELKQLKQETTSISYSNQKNYTRRIPNYTIPSRKPRSKLHQLSAPPKPLQSESIPQALHLIDNKELHLHDYFSDSWLLNKKNFLNMNIERIGIVEDACFEAVGKHKPYPHSKMFVDWTDFLVEHMSKWWKILRILDDPDPSMFEHTIKILKKYCKQVEAPIETSPLHDTISMISFAPYRGTIPQRAELLTAHALAATIASMYKVGFGRVLVTGLKEGDEFFVHKAFQLLDSTFNHHPQQQQRNNQTATKIGDTELAYVRMTNQTWISTKWVEVNIPRGSVVGMQLALSGEMKDPKETQKWLGSSQQEWKYVYLTEPDTILHTKSGLLPLIRNGLENGLSFFPHRLQPLPHESDFPPSSEDANTPHVSDGNQNTYIPSHVYPFSNVATLGSHDSCCDDGSTWIGRSEPFCQGGRTPCGGSMWWSLGFNRNQKDLTDEEILQQHERLVAYPMMRLGDGTGVVFASTNHGRRCLPSKTSCRNSTY
jgi:hypothetical protein